MTSASAKAGVFFPHLDQAAIPLTANLKDALTALSEAGSLLVCLVDQEKKLSSIITDSDVRRALLNGAALADPATKWSNHSPLVADATSSAADLRQLAHEAGKREIPLVDEAGKLRDIFVLGLYEIRQVLSASSREATPLPYPAFVLAGGLGTRLRTIVSDKPKPLAVVGNKPLLEIVLERLRTCGFRQTYVSVNFMAETIEEHLAHSKYQDMDIHIVREDRRLGTAGSIGYIKNDLNQPLLVCNADVLTTVRFDLVMAHHISSRADMTMVLRPYHVSIPFGVVQVDGERVTSIQEKPQINYLVNAGIYVLSPHVCSLIEEGEYLDMPNLLQKVMALGMKASPFYMHEYWRDVGKPEDYHRANEEFEQYFKDMM